jgi:hypothetical protein
MQRQIAETDTNSDFVVTGSADVTAETVIDTANAMKDRVVTATDELNMHSEEPKTTGTGLLTVFNVSGSIAIGGLSSLVARRNLPKVDMCVPSRLNHFGNPLAPANGFL